MTSSLLAAGRAAHGCIRLDNLTVSYQRHPAIHHVHGEFAPGSLTAIIGPNGAGKSTLLKVLAGLLQPDTGKVWLQGFHPRDIAYLPQQSQMDRQFPLTVLDTVLLGHLRRMGWLRGVRPTERHQALTALQAVGLVGFEERSLDSLSVGQLQRVLFARLMVQDAPVILLDEPFNAMDARTTADLLEIVRQWHGEGRTVIGVLHDYEQVRRYFPSTLLIAKECIGWGSTHEVLTPQLLQRANAMAEAWDETATPCERDRAAGTAPHIHTPDQAVS
jgi:zinc/manganese transport system ATP-binding protein